MLTRHFTPSCSRVDRRVVRLCWSASTCECVCVKTGCYWKSVQMIVPEKITGPTGQINTISLRMSGFFVLILTVCASCCLLGDWRSVTDQRQRVRCDDGQEEALWVAGLDFGAIRPHGQRLFCVRNHHTISEYYPHMLMWLLELVQTPYTLSGSCFLCLFSSLFSFLQNRADEAGHFGHAARD